MICELFVFVLGAAMPKEAKIIGAANGSLTGKEKAYLNSIRCIRPLSMYVILLNNVCRRK